MTINVRLGDGTTISTQPHNGKVLVTCADSTGATVWSDLLDIVAALARVRELI
jgi:hypothetical protein